MLGDRYLSEGPLNPRALFRFGWLLASIGENPRAEAIFRDLVAVFPRPWCSGELTICETMTKRPPRGSTQFTITHVRQAFPTHLQLSLRAVLAHDNQPSPIKFGTGPRSPLPSATATPRDFQTSGNPSADLTREDSPALASRDRCYGRPRREEFSESKVTFRTRSVFRVEPSSPGRLNQL